ncbi:hypothetical protein XI25_03285 [Paenibacillus sp. DMB20]|nr:hypothetical protein XI25_03285 [Paenibacillus sp. DMB20]
MSINSQLKEIKDFVSANQFVDLNCIVMLEQMMNSLKSTYENGSLNERFFYCFGDRRHTVKCPGISIIF